MHSHKSSSAKRHAATSPQRSNGRRRVAAILEAAEAVIAERGYEAATMAEIAARSGTKVGSLYRFFPNKESLADTLVASGREDVDAIFIRFRAALGTLSVRAMADGLLSLLFEPVLNKPALMKLLDAGPDWSVKRHEFRGAVLRQIAKTLVAYKPTLPKGVAADIALVILLNVKAASTHQGIRPRALEEFREMARLYLESRLQPLPSKTE